MLARLGLPLLFMTLAACSGPGDTPQPSESPDVWKPARPVVAKQWTDAEREAWRTDEFLPDTAARLDITNPPEVDLVRWITRDQWDATMSDCLTQAGFPTKPAVGGGLEHDPGIPVDQTPGYHLAIYRCEAQYTLEPKYSPGMTDEQKGLSTTITSSGSCRASRKQAHTSATHPAVTPSSRTPPVSARSSRPPPNPCASAFAS